MPQRILVVEDDDQLRYAICRELEAAEYEVSQAHDYRDALEILETLGKMIALLVIDLVLPTVNGFALARMARIRQRDIKVIYITGYENVPTTEAQGPVLHKPIEPDALLRVIRDALGDRTQGSAP